MSNSGDRPATTNAYPTHLLGGIAMLDLDSTPDGHVPRTFGQEYESDRRNRAQLRNITISLIDERSASSQLAQTPVYNNLEAILKRHDLAMLVNAGAS